MMDLVGVGVPCVDLLVNIDHLPASDESVRMNDYSWQGGGKVPTALVAMARLGSRVGMVARVSDDALGQFIVGDFKRHGVDTSRILIEKESRSDFSLVLSDKKTGGRNIIYKPGNLTPLSEQDLDLNYIFDSRIIHLSGSTEVDLEVAKAARAEGVKVAIDADSYKEIIIEMLPFIDYFIASEEFISDYSEKSVESAVREIAERGPEIAVVTLGERGCLSYHQGRLQYHQAFSVSVVDTTGAGDVFHGAFLHALLQGVSVTDCCVFANAVSAIKCTKMGGRAGLPTRVEVENFMETGEIVLKEADQMLEIYSDIPTTGKNIFPELQLNKGVDGS